VPLDCAILYNILLLVLILSVTLSTTETHIRYWKSTEYIYTDIVRSLTWSISSTSCYNTLTSTFSSYINGRYYNVYSTYTYSIWYSSKWSSTNTLYFSTTQSYTYSLLYTSGLVFFTSHYTSYVNTLIISTTNTLTITNSLTYYSTDIQYSTITRILAPSPSILPKNKCTCVLTLCNRIDLVLLTINNIV
jgi:hypothetical protein